uniref:Riboflavin transporter n=1 Tax=Timema californicum TaxID=61474 RepID=A0A7R9P5Q5_TIMCA|nr:unnamed protein product [Timema californicum]
MSFCNCQMALANHKLGVDLLAIFFGIGAWIGINGMYVQLPLIVQTQPEGWNLPSYLSIIIQVANIGPISYTLLEKFWPNKVKDSWLICGILSLGSTSVILMAFLYQKTTYIGGEEHSTALFALVFFVALVGCTSSVLFMPFMRHFRNIYLISYYVGEGLSGFVPSIAALVQGVGGNPTCIQSYSCLPYGNVAYHLSVTLGSMANPLACFLAFFLPYSSVRATSLMALICTLISCYIATTAVLSPSPPLVGTTGGEALVVLSWVIFTGLISYIKVSVATLFRLEGGRALFWCGAVQQMGSAAGAILGFFLVNFGDIFHTYFPCQDS